MGFEDRKPEEIKKSNESNESIDINTEIITTPEDLGGIVDKKLMAGKKIGEDFESSGKEGIDQISASIGLPDDKISEIKGTTMVESKIVALNKTAEEHYSELEQQLQDMFNDKSSDIKDIRAKMNELEEAHNNIMKEKRRKYEEVTRDIDNMSNKEKLKMIDDVERMMFGGKTLAEAKKDSDEFLKSLENQQKGFVENPTGKEGGNSNSLVEEMHTSESENEKRINQMQEYANKVVQETMQGVQQAMGEKTKVKFCPRCGRENERNSNFCPSCGNKLEEENKKENNESVADKIKKVQNFPELFQAIREIGPVKNSFDIESGSSEIKMVNPDMAIDAIKSFFSQDINKVVEEFKQGKNLLFLKENGIRDKVIEIFGKAIKN